MYVWYAVVVADPLVPVVVCAHAVVEHPPALLDELGEVPAGCVVFGVFAHVAHVQDDPFAEDCALDGCVACVQQIPLVLLDSLVNAIL